MAFADRVSVLRAGRNEATVEISQTSKSELARLMVGREVIFRVEKAEPELGSLVLELKNVAAENDKGLPALNIESMQLRRGEVLGIAGVAGKGQRELAEVVTGLRPVTDGRIMVLEQDMTNCSPLEFIRAGVAHVPGDRLGMGLAGNLPVSDNLIMKVYRRRPIANGPFLVNKAMTRFATEIVRSFGVMTPDVATPARNLSGGNQQKAILGREITSGKRSAGTVAPLLVAVYPTRGLDVGAIEAVRAAVLEQRAEGTAVLLISEDLEELLIMSDRIGVMHGGEFMGFVKPTETNVEELGLMMAGERRQ
jgi:ABC-type uncharacterized transport system ATPase subunit